MHLYHERIYDTLTLLADKGADSNIPQEMGNYLVMQKYVKITDDGKALITSKGLELLGNLESIKQKDMDRMATWVSIIATAAVSLLALGLSLYSLIKGGGS